MPGSALIIGASGFLGTELARRLDQAGWAVWCLGFAGRRASSAGAGRAVVADSPAPPDIQRALSGIAFDGVFHVAASGVNPGDRAPGALLEGNLQLLHSVLLALAGRKLEFFIYTGSCAEYGAVCAPKLLTENDPLNPADLYGAAKAATTLWAVALARELHIPLVCLRAFHVYGPGEASYRLVPALIDGLARNEAVRLTPGRQTRDLLFVEDAAHGFIRTAEASIEPYQILNLCSSQAVQIRQVAELTARLMNRPPKLLQFGALPYREDECMWIVGDNSRLRRQTGWAPQHDLTQGLLATIGALRPDAAQ